MNNPSLLAAFEVAAKALHAEGHSVVACVSSYDENADFSTLVLLNEDFANGVTDDHIVLDSTREIINEWSQAVHADDSEHAGD